MSQPSFLFEYPQVGLHVVSRSPPARSSVDGLTFGTDPEVVPYDAEDSSGDSDDYESDMEMESEEEEEEEEQAEPEVDWHPHAINFLAQVPQSDAAWTRYLRTSGNVNSLCHRLQAPLRTPRSRSDMDWTTFFKECTWHLGRACEDPPLASLFSLIFIAACHVALVDGCPREKVLVGIRACIRQCAVWEYELTEPMLDRLREGAVKGIKILTEYSRVIGSRAYELPLHIPDCMQLFMRCTPACTTFVKSHIQFTYRPTTPLHSERLETPFQVYKLLGGSGAGWSYREICQILQPDGVHLRLYNDIYMLDVMEYDESGDEEVVIRDCPVSAFQEQRAYEYRQLVGGGESGERGLAIF